jgi:hypothetical protein
MTDHELEDMAYAPLEAQEAFVDELLAFIEERFPRIKIGDVCLKFSDDEKFPLVLRMTYGAIP